MERQATKNKVILPYRPREKFIEYLDIWYAGKLPLSTEPGFDTWERELEENFKAENFYNDLVEEANADWKKGKKSLPKPEYQRRWISGKGQSRLSKRLTYYASKFPFCGEARHFLMEKIKVNT